MNNTRIVTIVCWVVAALALIGLAVFFLTGTIFGNSPWGNNWFGWNTGVENLTGPFHVQGEYSVNNSEIDSIYVNWVAGEINIIPHSGNDIRIIESAQRELRDNEILQYTVTGSTLTIRFTYRNVARRAPRKNLEILVPQALSESMNNLSVSTVSGEVYISGINANALECDVTSARINATGNFNRVNLNGVNGPMVLMNSAERSVLNVDNVNGATELSGNFETVNVSTVNGNTTVSSGIVPTSLDISGVNSRVNIYIPEGETITVNHSAVNGRLTNEVPVTLQSGNAQFNISLVNGNTSIMPIR